MVGFTGLIGGKFGLAVVVVWLKHSIGSASSAIDVIRKPGTRDCDMEVLVLITGQ
jgi:hypothetical protein